MIALGKCRIFGRPPVKKFSQKKGTNLKTITGMHSTNNNYKLKL